MEELQHEIQSNDVSSMEELRAPNKSDRHSQDPPEPRLSHASFKICSTTAQALPGTRRPATQASKKSRLQTTATMMP